MRSDDKEDNSEKDEPKKEVSGSFERPNLSLEWSEEEGTYTPGSPSEWLEKKRHEEKKFSEPPAGLPTQGFDGSTVSIDFEDDLEDAFKQEVAEIAKIRNDPDLLYQSEEALITNLLLHYIRKDERPLEPIKKLNEKGEDTQKFVLEEDGSVKLRRPIHIIKKTNLFPEEIQYFLKQMNIHRSREEIIIILGLNDIVLENKENITELKEWVLSLPLVDPTYQAYLEKKEETKKIAPPNRGREEVFALLISQNDTEATQQLLETMTDDEYDKYIPAINVFKKIMDTSWGKAFVEDFRLALRKKNAEEEKKEAAIEMASPENATTDLVSSPPSPRSDQDAVNKFLNKTYLPSSSFSIMPSKSRTAASTPAPPTRDDKPKSSL